MVWKKLDVLFNVGNRAHVCIRNLINIDLMFSFKISAKKKPFRVGVRFDETEICSAAKGTTCEWDTVSGGIIGFKLIYWQTSC